MDTSESFCRESGFPRNTRFVLLSESRLRQEFFRLLVLLLHAIVVSAQEPHTYKSSCVKDKPEEKGNHQPDHHEHESIIHDSGGESRAGFELCNRRRRRCGDHEEKGDEGKERSGEQVGRKKREKMAMNPVTRDA